MIVLLAMMTAIPAAMRLIPFLFSKWLNRWTALEKLSTTLPMCISILLVAHLLEQTPFTIYPLGCPNFLDLQLSCACISGCALF